MPIYQLFKKQPRWLQRIERIICAALGFSAIAYGFSHDTNSLVVGGVLVASFMFYGT